MEDAVVSLVNLVARKQSYGHFAIYPSWPRSYLIKICQYPVSFRQINQFF
jgi:hypothetical protein